MTELYFFPGATGKTLLLCGGILKGGKKKREVLAVKRQGTSVSAKMSTPQSLRPMGSPRCLLFWGFSARQVLGLFPGCLFVLY